MPKQYDALLKDLPEIRPRDWAQFAGAKRSAPVLVIDADVSTVTAAADKVLRVDEPDPWLLTEPAVLEGLATRLLDVESWAALLAGS